LCIAICPVLSFRKVLRWWKRFNRWRRNRLLFWGFKSWTNSLENVESCRIVTCQF